MSFYNKSNNEEVTGSKAQVDSLNHFENFRKTQSYNSTRIFFCHDESQNMAGSYNAADFSVAINFVLNSLSRTDRKRVFSNIQTTRIKSQ